MRKNWKWERMKKKSFLLSSGYVEEIRWELNCVVYAAGSFKQFGGFTFTEYKRYATEKNRKKWNHTTYLKNKTYYLFKTYKRRRKLGTHLISFIHPGCELHHVNINDIVSTPKKIHRLTQHTAEKNKIEGVLG